MSVWLAIPSARPVEEVVPVLKSWRERGYNIIIQRDPNCGSAYLGNVVDLQIERAYEGYAEAVNYLCKSIWAIEDSLVDFFVVAGDDTLPDPNHSAEEIARECRSYFCKALYGEYAAEYVGDTAPLKSYGAMTTFGVMQPTGDDWSDSGGRIIERVAGSPWIGREFCRRMYGGNGPLWHGYYHMFEDEELQLVAQHHGVFWQRPDLIHKHMHWGRPRDGEKMAHVMRRPVFLDRANSPDEWRKAKAEYEARRAAGWPGSEPIE